MKEGCRAELYKELSLDIKEMMKDNPKAAAAMKKFLEVYQDVFTNGQKFVNAPALFAFQIKVKPVAKPVKQIS